MYIENEGIYINNEKNKKLLKLIAHYRDNNKKRCYDECDNSVLIKCKKCISRNNYKNGRFETYNLNKLFG